MNSRTGHVVVITAIPIINIPSYESHSLYLLFLPNMHIDLLIVTIPGTVSIRTPFAIKEPLPSFFGQVFPLYWDIVKAFREDRWLSDLDADEVDYCCCAEAQDPSHLIHVLPGLRNQSRLVRSYKARETHDGSSDPGEDPRSVDAVGEPIKSTFLATVE